MQTRLRASTRASLAPSVSLDQLTRDADLKSEIQSFWVEHCVKWASVFEFADHVAKKFDIDASLVNAWRTIGHWPVPGDDPSRKTFIGYFDEDDPRDFAFDPLHDFYGQHEKNGNRRSALTYLSEGGYLRPSEINLDLVQHLLHRYPISLEDLSTYLCVESQFFPKYARANGIVDRVTKCPHQPLLSLLYIHNQLQQVVVTHAQHLYRIRAVPIRFIACRLNLNWRELWALGAERGIWQMPSTETLSYLDEYFSSRKTSHA